MISFAIPGNLDAPTGGYVYARRVMAEWTVAEVVHRVVGLSGAFPAPSRFQMDEANLALETAAAPLLIDGLAYGAFSVELAKLVGPRSTVLLHHPLCDETGLSQEQADAAFERERLALAEARHVIVTSPLTGRDLSARFEIAPDRITVAEPGLDRAGQAPLAGDPPRILAVGSVTPRKGYTHLVAALATCADLPWHCDIFGAMDRADAEVARVMALIEAHGLDARIHLRGAAPQADLEAAYATADLFAAPSLHEGYGMAVTEAMARGLPVLAANAGALPETAPMAVFVPPADTDALAAALRRLLSDPDARHAAGAASRSHALSRPTWNDTARTVAAALGVSM